MSIRIRRESLLRVMVDDAPLDGSLSLAETGGGGGGGVSRLVMLLQQSMPCSSG